MLYDKTILLFNNFTIVTIIVIFRFVSIHLHIFLLHICYVRKKGEEWGITSLTCNVFFTVLYYRNVYLLSTITW